MSNFIELVKRPNWTLYQYHVSFEPEIESKRVKFALLGSNPGIFRNSKAFDGSILYSTVKSETGVRNFNIKTYQTIKKRFNSCLKKNRLKK